MDISIAVMSHLKRREQAHALVDMLLDMPFSSVIAIYDTDDDEWATGRRALKEFSGLSTWHVVIQDDAIIHPHFYNNLVRALIAVPRMSLISLYTGTVRPEQKRIQGALASAQRQGASWMSSNSLYWGVGIAIPTDDIHPMLAAVRHSILPYDRRIGSYFEQNGRPIYYTVPSIVDHDYTLPSLLNNDRPGPARRAHNYCPSSVDFNDQVVRIV